MPSLSGIDIALAETSGKWLSIEAWCKAARHPGAPTQFPFTLPTGTTKVEHSSNLRAIRSNSGHIGKATHENDATADPCWPGPDGTRLWKSCPFYCLLGVT
jgi:hypothetical protein